MEMPADIDQDELAHRILIAAWKRPPQSSCRVLCEALRLPTRGPNESVQVAQTSCRQAVLKARDPSS